MASLTTSHIPNSTPLQKELSLSKRNSGSEQHSFSIVCFGDSLTEGMYNFGRAFKPYSDALSEELNVITSHDNSHSESIECEALGFSGYTTIQLLRQMRKHEEVFLKDADLVLIMAGTNDIGRSHNVFDAIENLETIHKLAWDRGIHTVAMTIPESRVTVNMDEYKHRRIALNEAIREEIAEKKPDLCHFLDITSLNPFSDEKDEQGGMHLWDNDGLHMTAEGYNQFGKRLAPQLKPIIDKILALRKSHKQHSNGRQIEHPQGFPTPHDTDPSN